ncbi:MAG TPA: hypothetical protein VGB04_09600 [Allosphingosinicella sp.]|jgi:hypothetical protein
MTDPESLLALSGSVLLAIGLSSAVLLKGWQGWLELRRSELAARDGGSRRAGSGTAEVRELRERVRRLEAIASGGEV